jgi:lysine-specific demethylase/histidyl-hydroxylase NO66
LQELPDNYTRISRENLPSEFKKITLHKGDCLYLPRGTIHEAIAKDSFSSHVTISIYQHYNMKTLISRTLPFILNNAFEQNLNMRKGLPIKLTETLGSFASKKIEIGKLIKDTTNQNIITSRQNMLKECQDIVSSLANYVTIDTIDLAVDDLAIDFIENRLPPPINIELGKKGKGKLSAQSTVRLIDPNVMQCSIQEVEGVSLLCVFNALNNNRLSHMGHPLENEDDDDEESEQAETLTFPARLVPIIVSLQQFYPTTTKISEISKLMKLCQIHADEVLDTIQTLSQNNFIEYN